VAGVYLLDRLRAMRPEPTPISMFLSSPATEKGFGFLPFMDAYDEIKE